MVQANSRDVRLEQISQGKAEPGRPSETIEAQFWPAVAIGSVGFLSGLAITDVPVIGGFFEGDDGGVDTTTVVLVAAIVIALLVLSGTVAIAAT